MFERESHGGEPISAPSKRLHQLALRPDALRVHFELGLRAWDVQDLYGIQRHRGAVGMLPEGGPSSLEFLALRWRELWLQGDQEAALDLAREAVGRYPDDADTALELSDILGDLGRNDEALEALMEGARRNQDDPDLWYELGLAAETSERWELRNDAFRRVWDLEHDHEPPSRVWVPEERFVELAQQALDRLPPMARQALGNVAILVEDYPDEWIFDTEMADPRVMGLFSGAEFHAQQAGTDCVVHEPSVIHLYRWNIERVCGSDEEVEEQVQITVLHEVGHYLGLDEDALTYIGLG